MLWNKKSLAKYSKEYTRPKEKLSSIGKHLIPLQIASSYRAVPNCHLA